MVVLALDLDSVARADGPEGDWPVREATAPSYSIRVAQVLVKCHGLEALPTGPVDVWAGLPNARSIAEAQPGMTGIAASLAATSGIGAVNSWVEQKTLDTIPEQARAGAITAGVDREFSLQEMSLPTSVTWTAAASSTLRRQRARATCATSTCPALAAAGACKGDLVGSGGRVRMDLETTVRHR